MITLIWNGSRYQGQTLLEVREDFLRDPRTDSWEAMVARVNKLYDLQLSAEPSRSAVREVIFALRKVGEIQAIKCTMPEVGLTEADVESVRQFAAALHGEHPKED